MPQRTRPPLSFEATRAFTNPMGEVLGAFQAAMLYDTMGPALLARIGPEEFIEALQLNVHFLNPTKPGRLIGVGRVIQRAGDMATLEGTLSTTENVLLATAIAVARVIPAKLG
jgi:acyl-coenzyme A thioesterase PaaI-like protein